jgi:transposase
MFYAIDVESRIRADHPLRPIRRLVDEELAKMSVLFDAAYTRDNGRPSVPPERLLKALLLQCLYSIRSETQLVERIDTDLLFRWFLEMDPAQDAFDQTTFTHNRPRLEQHGIVAAFFDGVVRRAMKAGLTSDEHFTVDGTLIESHASIKSFVSRDASDADKDDRDGNGFKPRNAEVNFHGQRRSNATHASTTDPQAKLYKKSDGQAARLYHMGHALAENRHGLLMGVCVSEAAGDAEPTAALGLVDQLRHRHAVSVATLGSDKGYDQGPYLLELEKRDVKPHTAMKAGAIGGVTMRTRPSRRRKIDRPPIEARRRMRRRQRTRGYRLSQRCRKKIEEAFGWIKTVATLARTKLVGRWKITQQMHLAAAAYNLVRMRKLAA